MLKFGRKLKKKRQSFTNVEILQITLLLMFLRRYNRIKKFFRFNKNCIKGVIFTLVVLSTLQIFILFFFVQDFGVKGISNSQTREILTKLQKLENQFNDLKEKVDTKISKPIKVINHPNERVNKYFSHPPIFNKTRTINERINFRLDPQKHIYDSQRDGKYETFQCHSETYKIYEEHELFQILDKTMYTKMMKKNINDSLPVGTCTNIFEVDCDNVKDKKLAVIIAIATGTSDMQLNGGIERCVHMSLLISQMRIFLKNVNYRLIFVYQNNINDVGFNKGALFNIGVLLLEGHFDYLIFHDLDWLPMDYKNAYVYQKKAIHRASYGYYVNEEVYAVPRENCGQVMQITTDNYYEIGGYSNLYWIYGAEDHDFCFRIANYSMIRKMKLGNYLHWAHSRMSANSTDPEIKKLVSDENGETYKNAFVERKYVDGLVNFIHDVDDVKKHKWELLSETHKHDYSIFKVDLLFNREITRKLRWEEQYNEIIERNPFHKENVEYFLKHRAREKNLNIDTKMFEILL